MKRLLIFPSEPTNSNGYGIAVQRDMEKLNITSNDTVIFYQRNRNFSEKKDNFFYVLAKPWLSIHGILNFLRLRIPTELPYESISKICNEEFDYIFIGDSVIYRAIRKLYPKNKVYIRLHNIYHRSFYTRIKNAAKIGAGYKTREFLMMRLEDAIFKDKNTQLITISDTDNEWLIDNKIFNSEVWPVISQIKTRTHSHIDIYKKHIAWFGSTASHNKVGLEWFLQSILPKLRDLDSDIVFHMFGQGTEKYNNPKIGQIGHGFYKDTPPPLGGNAIFINPDLIGLGVKMKLNYFIDEDLITITTPEGAIGYNLENLTNITVSNPQNWVRDICSIMNISKIK